MGLDVGDRTIGVALSDPLGWTAQGLEVRRRTTLEEDLEYIDDVARRHEVEGIVVGLPLNMNGTSGPQAEKVRDFARELEKELTVWVDYWDERLTTRAAEQALLEADMSRARRKTVIDQVAAALILQNYLDSGAWRSNTKTSED